MAGLEARDCGFDRPREAGRIEEDLEGIPVEQQGIFEAKAEKLAQQAGFCTGNGTHIAGDMFRHVRTV